MSKKNDKIETPERIEKRKAKVEKELAKLEKEKAKPQKSSNMAYFVIIITIVYVVDEITTQIGTQMQSVIASQVFAPIFGEEVAVARMSLIGTIGIIAGFFAMFYKTLSDKYGRRIFLVINTFGMALGMFLVSISTGIPVYLLGTMFISFFTPHDMQAIYIQECAPIQKRATMYSVIKASATLGMLLISVLRSIFIPGNDLSNWRFVYMVPAVIGIIVAIIAFFHLRESDAFIDYRIKRLKMSDEEREAAKNSKDHEASEGGIINAAKYIFSHKQLLWITLSAGFIMFGAIIATYYETVLNYGYAGQFVNEALSLEQAVNQGMATPYVNKALTLFAIGSAICQFIPGFIADAKGRRMSVICMSVLSVTTYVLFYLGSYNIWNPYLVGALIGIAVGAYYAAVDMVALLCTESTPTNLRVSVETTRTILSFTVHLISLVVSMILINVLGDAKIAIVSLITACSGLTIGIAFLMLKVKDTKGINMSTVSSKDFE